MALKNFPHGAFTQSSLKDTFSERAYLAQDVMNIRSSYYYSPITTNGALCKYRVSYYTASREPDGQFRITKHAEQVTKDPVENNMSMEEIDTKFADVVCTQNEVIKLMNVLIAEMKKDSRRTEAYPKDTSPYELNNHIHINTADKIFSAQAPMPQELIADDIRFLSQSQIMKLEF